MAGRHGLHPFIAELDGRPVATAALLVRRQAGLLGFTAVLPEARGRGLQQALIAIRAARAAELGCDLIAASAIPDGASDRNLARSGLRAVGRMGLYRLEPADATAAARQ
jgi:GNAT superfamily N-acetyltransferase